MQLYIFWVLFLLCLVGANDCDVLAIFGNFNTTASAVMGWNTSLHNWCCLSSSSSSGIECDENNRVVTLVLDHQQISGSFDVSFAQLTKLTNFSASFNLFNNSNHTSSLPYLPSSLTYLDLTGNLLSGDVPHWLLQFPDLTRLALENNSFTGVLPPIISSPLEWLDLGYNYLSGPLSPLENLTSLELLQLYANSFTGNLVPLKSLVNLKELDLSGNVFTGTLSPIGNLTQLINVIAPFNCFTGDLSIVKNFPQLEILFLGQNELMGTLEPLTLLTNLQSLNVANNLLTGTLFPLQHLTQLVTIELDNNKFYGSLSPLSSLKNLKYLVLLENDFTGNLEFLENSVNLHWLVLGQNSLNGSLSPLQNLTNLTWLSLQENFFTGVFAPVVSCTQLTYVNISNNLLSGDVYLHTLIHLQQFRASMNRFSGSFSLSPSIQYFDISRNFLRDFIVSSPEMSPPSSSAVFSSLEVFNISFNCFQNPFDSLELSADHPTLLDIRENPFLCPYPERSALVIVALTPCVYSWATLRILIIAIAACVAFGLLFLVWRACCRTNKNSFLKSCLAFIVMWLVRVVSVITTALSLWQMYQYMPTEVRDQDRACHDVNNRAVFDLVFTEIIVPPLPGNTLKEYVEAFKRESELPLSSLDMNLASFQMLCTSFPRCGYIPFPWYVCASVSPPFHVGFTYIVTISSLLFCVVEFLKILPLFGCLFLGEKVLKGRGAHLCSRSVLSPLLLAAGKKEWFKTYVVMFDAQPWDYVLELGYVGLPGGLFLSLMVYYHLYVLQTDWTPALYLSMVSNARNVLTLLFRMRLFFCCFRPKKEEASGLRQSFLEHRQSSINE